MEWSNYFRLSASQVEIKAPAKPGLYKLAHTDSKDESKCGHPYYIGKAEDLAKRLNEHIDPSDKCLAKHAKQGDRWFSFAECVKSDLVAEEKKLINSYGLSTLDCNEKI